MGMIIILTITTTSESKSHVKTNRSDKMLQRKIKEVFSILIKEEGNKK